MRPAVPGRPRPTRARGSTSPSYTSSACAGVTVRAGGAVRVDDGEQRHGQRVGPEPSSSDGELAAHQCVASVEVLDDVNEQSGGQGELVERPSDDAQVQL